jgi:hypothetical protein
LKYKGAIMTIKQLKKAISDGVTTVGELAKKRTCK